MSGDAREFEDRVTLAVVDALAGTAPFWVRGIAVDVDARACHVVIHFASAEHWGDIRDGIAAFSSRLEAATSTWLRHTTEHWIGPGLDLWPARHDRVVYATRVPPPGQGMNPEGEFENFALVTIAGAMVGGFGPTLWGLSFTSEARTRTVDVFLAFAAAPTRQDRYELEEFMLLLGALTIDTEFRPQIWVGHVDDFEAWPGFPHRPVFRHRCSRTIVPFDFED